MQAGTIALLDDPADEPLESATTGGHTPALSVSETQQDLTGDAVAQQGEAAGAVSTVETDISVIEKHDDITIVTEELDGSEQHHTEWVADVTGHGIVCVESLGGNGDMPFPLDLIAAQTGAWLQPVTVDIESLVASWGDEFDTWYTGRREGDEGAHLGYHEDAGHPTDANVGLGFRRHWESTVAEGVIYQSGYIAIYSPWTASVFIKFVADEVLAHCETDDLQATLGDED